MLKTKEETPKEISFFYACRLNGADGGDITDKDWNWGIFLNCPLEDDIAKLDDAYDKFCLLLCLNLKCERFVPDWYTPCDVAAFIDRNREAFDRFFDEVNREEFRPSDYPKRLESDEDEGFYEVYMVSMENLIAGNYSDSDYEKLVGYLLGAE